MIRRAEKSDIPEIVKIYEEILEREETGSGTTGWIRGIYPTRATAQEALEREELFVSEEEGKVLAAAKINQEQVPEYVDASWEYEVPGEQIMVLHTLVVSPRAAGKGLGTKFVNFYEEFALQHGCRYLRMDTNQINTPARKLYERLGYKEVGIVPCNFNGIENVQLVCLEKKL